MAVRYLILELFEDLVAGFDDAGAVMLPGVGKAFEQRLESGAAVTIVRREIGAAEKRAQVRSQKDAHRPAPRPCGRLDKRHVNAIDVRPLLAVYFDRDEMPVENFGNPRALERLPLHDVEPVAGGRTKCGKEWLCYC